MLSAVVVPPGALAGETRSAPPGYVGPAATVDELGWLVGEWVGEGISGAAREVYSAPMGGAIAGHFVQLGPNGVAFYEFVTIAPDGPSLAYRIKHFNADMTGWEEKAEVRSFKLGAREGDAWYFDGLTLRRDGPDGLVSAVTVQAQDGTQREYVFRYRRVR